jgi:hypothetical protein
MKNLTIKNSALLLAVLLAFSSCAATKVAKDPHAQYLGDWEYVVEELPVDIDGTMTLSKEEGVLKALLSNPMGDMELDAVSIVDGVFKAELDADGTLVEMEGTFEGDAFAGYLSAQGADFVMKAKKVQ